MLEGQTTVFGRPMKRLHVTIASFLLTLLLGLPGFFVLLVAYVANKQYNASNAGAVSTSPLSSSSLPASLGSGSGSGSGSGGRTLRTIADLNCDTGG